MLACFARRPALVLLLALLLAPLALATTLVAMPTEELFARADVVAVVEIRSVRTVQAGGRITTFAEADLSRVYKGPAAGSRITITVPGGAAGDLVQRVAGAPDLREGETSVAFLEDAGGGMFQYVGLEQGRLEIAPDLGVAGGWVVLRSITARLVRRTPDGGLEEASPPLAREPLGEYLEKLRRLEGTR